MIDLYFRATSERALEKMFEATGFPSAASRHRKGVDVLILRAMVLKVGVMNHNGSENTPIKEIIPSIIDTQHIYANVRLSGDAVSLAGEVRSWIKRNNVTERVPSKRRDGVTHTWFSHNFGGGDFVELIDPSPQNPRRRWF